MTTNQPERRASVPAEHFPEESQRDTRGNLIFLAADLLIRSIKEELETHPAFSRALTERYFTSINGIPNDRSRQTCFSQNGFDYRVGYEYHYDAPGGSQEILETIKKGPLREERLLLNAHRYLREPTDGLFTYEGLVSFQRIEKDGTTTAGTVDTAQAAHALIERLLLSAGRFRFFE